MRRMRSLAPSRGLQPSRAVRGSRHLRSSVFTQPVTSTLRTTPHAAAAAPRTTVDSSAQSGTAGFDSVEDGIAAIARGEFVLVMDDQDRENEGDLIIAAEMVTQQKIAYMVEYTSGAAWLPSCTCSNVIRSLWHDVRTVFSKKICPWILSAKSVTWQQCCSQRSE